MRVFDLDHTLITSNISVDFGRHLRRRGVISLGKLVTLFFWYGRHKWLGLGIEALHEAVFTRLFKGIPFQLILDEVDQFFLATPPKLFAATISLLQTDSVVLSSSPDFLVARVCKMLNIKDFKASTYAIDKEGRLCHIAEVIEGAEKAKELEAIIARRGLQKEEITYYTDSIWDAPVFEVAGKTIAVCPDRKLRRLAKSKQWEILHEGAVS